METKQNGARNNEVVTAKRQELNKGIEEVANATSEAKEKKKEMEEPKKRKYSPAYMLKNYKTLIRNLDETGILDEESKEMLKEVGKRMIEQHVSIDMFD